MTSDGGTHGRDGPGDLLSFGTAGLDITLEDIKGIVGHYAVCVHIVLYVVYRVSYKASYKFSYREGTMDRVFFFFICPSFGTNQTQ